MDLSLRDLERRAAADPADGAATAALARALVRAGRLGEARKALRTRIAAAEIDADTLALALEVGEESIQGSLPRSPRANMGYVMRTASHDGLAELAPQIAFAGVPGSGARECVLALRCLLAGHIEEERAIHVDDEHVIDLRFALARPWIVTRSYAVRSVRLVTIPVAPHALKLRRKLLKGTSALAFVVDSRTEEPANESAWKALATDFRRANGFALEALPIALVYCDPVEPSKHKKLTAGVGLTRVPRVTASISTTGVEPEPGAPRFARLQDDDRVTTHEGTIEVLSLLLTGVAAAVKGVAAPRPRFRR